ncbi:MAG: hypothetical protein P8Y64_07885 [Gammaproteobacteria bacterium]|jgi:hypothetical protein
MKINGHRVNPTAMIQFARSLSAYGTPSFNEVVQTEIENLGADSLPLQAGLSRSSVALDDDIRAMVISVSEEPGSIRVKAGIFYAGIIAGCSCADDPTPVDVQPEYCEVRFDIDKHTGRATATLLTDDR